MRLSRLVIVLFSTSFVLSCNHVNTPDDPANTRLDGGTSKSGTSKHGVNLYPPAGKILHMSGQNREDFADYLTAVTQNGSAIGLPAGVAFYSNLLRWGFHEPRSNRPGDHAQHLDHALGHYQPLIPQIQIWADSSELERINSGRADDDINKLAVLLRSYKRPIYMRFGGEFDDGRYKDPEAYQRAYRRIVDAFVTEGVSNVSYVWHSIGMKPTYQRRDISDWYPGDAYVNWVGISVFQISAEGYFEDHNRDRVVAFAREKNLPVMVVESSAIRTTKSQRDSTGQDYWDYWYAPYFAFIEENPEVRAFSIIHSDWDSQDQFQRLGWGDCRLTSDPVVLQNWREIMLKDRYLHSNAQLYQQLGFSGPTEE